MDPVFLLTARDLDSDEQALRLLQQAESLEAPPSLNALQTELPEAGTTVGGHRLCARLLAQAGQTEDAERVLLAVLESLNQAGFWRSMTHLAEQLLDDRPREAAPLVARARTQGGEAVVPLALLERAHRASPRHGLLSWQTALALTEAGRESEGRRLAALALTELVLDKNYDLAEEALLLIAEDRHPETIRALTRTAELLAKQEALTELDTVLEVAGGAFSDETTASTVWPVLRETWRRFPDRDSLRAAAILSAKAFFASYPDPAGLVRTSEIDRPSLPVETVLERIAKALKFPPGYFGRHSGWGLGKIRDNDTEHVTLDFPAKPMHRMTFATAGNALQVLSPDDLRVRALVDPEGTAKLAKSDKAGTLIQTLRILPDRAGTADEIKRVLVPEVITPQGWSTWWKAARADATAHPEIDTSRAHEDQFRLVLPGEAGDEVELPRWDLGRGVRDALTLLDRFLENQADAAERLLETLGPEVEAVTGDDDRSPEERAMAGLWLLRHDPDTEARPETAITPAFDINVLNKEEQTALVARLREPAALAKALDSRLVAARKQAWTGLVTAGAAADAARDILRGAPAHPEAVLHLLSLDDSPLPDADEEAGARRLLALLDLLERPPRETHRTRAMKLVDAKSPLARALKRHPLPESRSGELATRLTQWKASDRFRFPVIDLLRELKESELAETIEDHRQRRVAKLGERIAAPSDDPFDGDVLITRPTLDRLHGEQTRVGMELKTTIPAAIQKAREFGDLKENAEYHAAKEKQASYAKRLEELDGLLQRIRLIENLEREPGVALPGTEVDLEPVEDGKPVRFWLLGEGDQDLGDAVVSYRAPVGQAILGKRSGDTVELPGEAAGRPYRVTRVSERLP